MIINVRGTSGSGKSTIVRNAMDLFTWRGPVHVKGRKQPLGYWLGPNKEDQTWQQAGELFFATRLERAKVT